MMMVNWLEEEEKVPYKADLSSNISPWNSQATWLENYRWTLGCFRQAISVELLPTTFDFILNGKKTHFSYFERIKSLVHHRTQQVLCVRVVGSVFSVCLCVWLSPDEIALKAYRWTLEEGERKARINNESKLSKKKIGTKAGVWMKSRENWK